MQRDALQNKYESLRSLIVWLGLAELVWISYWLLRTVDGPRGYTTTVGGWIVAMLGWLVLVIYAGRKGFFLQHTRYLSNLVGVILVIAAAAIFFGATPAAREGLVRAATSATHRELATIHILRLLDIGTIIKYCQRQLPLHFLILGALPDFLFALSAVWVTSIADNLSPSPEFLFAWHLMGSSVFFGAGISMFFSVPSPLRIYRGEPDASIVFRFPMLLAPNFTVPLFMLAHALALVKLMANG